MSDPAVNALCRFLPKYLQFLRAGIGGASPTRVLAMQVLAGAEEMSMADLANRLSVSKRNVTGLIDAMERDGLARRAPHPTDRRVKLVGLTEAGRARHHDATAQQHARIDDLLSGLAAPERAALAATLEQISAALEARKG